MSKYPKYILLPVALAIYCLAMGVYSYKRNGGQLPEDFFLIVLCEAVIIVALFFVLRYQHKKRNGEES